jgi:peptide/nickel transport system permease protein
VKGIAKKIGYAFFTMYLSLTAIFFVVRLSPGDPVELILGPNAKAEELIKLKTQLGLDKSLKYQYIDYFKKLSVGDLGKSLVGSKDVKSEIKSRLGATFILAFLSVCLSSFIGIFLGIIAGSYKSTAWDSVVRLISLGFLSFPIFSLAPILVLIFSIKLGLLPVSEWGEIKHIILPVITLAMPLSAVITRVTRNKFLEENKAQWVVVLKSKGLNEVQILKRIVRVCLPTILNIISIQLSVVIAGTMITETIYDIPGLGTLLFEAIGARDYPVVQAVIIYSTFSYMIIYFLVEYINELIDPRLQEVNENA